MNRRRTAAGLLNLSLLLPAGSCVWAQEKLPSSDVEAAKAAALRETELGQSDAAIRDYRHALALDPAWHEGWWNLATVEYGANLYAEAEPNLQKVVGFAPRMGIAWAILGLCEFETKDWVNSREHLQKSIDLGVDDAETSRVAAYHLALLLIRAGQFDDARTLLLARFPGASSSPQIVYALGLALLRVPLLPSEVDPTREGLVQSAGALTGAQADQYVPLLKTYPATPFLRLAYADALAREQRSEEALAQLKVETELSPDSPLPWLAISALEEKAGRHSLAAAAAARASALKASSPTSSRAAAFYKGKQDAGPREAPSAWQQSMQAYASGNYAAAIEELKPLVQFHPEDGTGWAVLGLSEFALSDYGNARVHLLRGHSLRMNGSVEAVRAATYTLSLLMIRDGDFDRASALLGPASRANPNDREVTYALGLCLLRRAELPGEVPASESALVMKAGRIAGLLEDSRYDDAFSEFKPLLATYPAEPFLHYAYGTALLALSRFDEAAEAMRAESVLSPKSELPDIKLASIRIRQHQSSDAIPFARSAIRLAPASAEAHYLLGRASLDSGDDATAISELEAAARLSPDSPEIHFNLARAYARAKRAKEAASERETFARLNAAAENEKSQGADQRYAGPRDEGLPTPVTTRPQP